MAHIAPEWNNAALLSRVVGWICIVVCAVSVATILNEGRKLNTLVLVIGIAMVSLLFFGPGFVYLFFAGWVKRGSRAGTITLLCVMLPHTAIVFITMLIAMFNKDATSTSGLFHLILIIFMIASIIMLSRSLKVIARNKTHTPRGFEPMMQNPQAPSPASFPLPPASLQQEDRPQ